MDTKATVSAVKEVARLVLFAALSAVVTWATTQLTALDPSSVYVVVGTVVLRFVDKYLHDNKDVKLNGIAPF